MIITWRSYFQYKEYNHLELRISCGQLYLGIYNIYLYT